MLKLTNFTVFFQSTAIVQAIDLAVKRDEIVVLMGPNGSGKSTLASAIMGHPHYTISPDSSIEIDGEEISKLPPNKRAQKGVYLAFQNPVAIPGVSLTKILRETHPEISKNTTQFMQDLRYFAKGLNFSEGLLLRGLNDGFSGGERKKVEMVQARYYAKKYALFDEIDTGLDMDAIKKIAIMINELKKKHIGCLVITHYQRMIDFLDVDRIIVMAGGKIVDEGGKTLIKKIEKDGYGQYAH